MCSQATRTNVECNMQTVTITLSSCESGYTPILVPSPPHINASSSSTSSMETLVFEVTIAMEKEAGMD